MTRQKEEVSETMTTHEAVDAAPDQQASDRAAQRRRQRTRSIAIALALAFLVMLFYAATLIRLGGKVLERTL